MPKRETFYITSPIFYPNANLHMGHAYTMTLCDVIARYHRIKGESVYFLTGTDENTGKVVRAAAEKNLSVETFLSGITGNFKKLFGALGISFDQFIQTTDKQRHWPGATALWKKLVEAGDIYKSVYEGLYCQSCEAFYTEKDLIDGKCPYHGIVLEKIKEENYFFKLSKYADQIKSKIDSRELNIIPESRKNEILSLLDRGLDDISFSRPIASVPHGIPVPGDPQQVIYVWCDALVNYISALGYGTGDQQKFETFWPADVHVIGKDILRFHAAIWPAMLLSAGVSLPQSLLVHGFITSEGRKMSKSLGNVIDPWLFLSEYGKDALRYFLIREISPFEDGDITVEKFKEAYNANLANGLGNLVSRIMKMATTHLDGPVQVVTKELLPPDYVDAFECFDVQKAAHIVWQKIGELDARIQAQQPFKLVKEDKEKAKKIITELVVDLAHIADLLAPMLSETSEKIRRIIADHVMPEAPLFVRKD